MLFLESLLQVAPTKIDWALKTAHHLKYSNLRHWVGDDFEKQYVDQNT